jgi:two-component system sensor histidine kinase RegB
MIKRNSENLIISPEILIKLRWAAILTQAFFVFLAFYLSLITYRQFVYSILILIPLFMFNQFITYSSYRSKLAFLQLLADLIVSFLLLYVNGGHSNPFSLILIIPLFISPFILKLRDSFYFFPIPILCYFLLGLSPFEFNLFSVGEDKSMATFLVGMTICLTIWLISHWLVAEMSKLNSQVNSLKDFSQKIERYRSLGLLTAGVCHELGTPLNTALMKLNRLRRTSTKEPFPQDLEVILKNINRCSESLKKLNTSFHSVETESNENTVEFISIIKKACQEYQQKHPLDICITNNKETSLELPLPNYLLYRSIIDLLDNAREADATSLEIEITGLENKIIRVDFRDNGRGFNPDVLKNIGSPFNSDKQEGTGLGVYQLNNTLSYVGGALEVISSHTGSTIRLSLPRRD